MNKQQEALKLALEALESDPLDMVLNPDGHMGFRKDQAITAIREALAEQPAKCKHNVFAPYRCTQCEAEQPASNVNATGGSKAFFSLAEQPAQQDNPHPEYCKGYAAGLEAGTISEKKSVQQQEPVAFYVYKPTLPKGHLGNVSDGDLPWVYDQDPSSGFSARMLVTPITSPPANANAGKPWVHATTWQGLTDEQIMEMYNEPRSDAEMIAFARAIEAKLREKNA